MKKLKGGSEVIWSCKKELLARCFSKRNIRAQIYNSWKKEPRLKVGGPNQKPLTIKPYPMKIRG